MTLTIIDNPSPPTWKTLIRRGHQSDLEVLQKVSSVLNDVKLQGDRALFNYTEAFDGVALLCLHVSKDELQDASRKVSSDFKDAVHVAVKNLRKFHEAQWEVSSRIETMPGVTCWRKSVPIESIGIYVPGGTAPLCSSLLMAGVPSQIAGCSRRVVVTPPLKDGSVSPEILYCASVVGITEIYRIGGSQAIAALGYGTESISCVDKIVGPGNRYVTAAKSIVQQEGVAIDMPAGPSEVLVIADESANPLFVSADLIAQAEHGSDSHAILVSTSRALIDEVNKTLNELAPTLPRHELIDASLRGSYAVWLPDLTSALAFANAYAPEHLILAVCDPHTLSEGVRHAGSVFLGHFTPESVGDYASGTNHTLPTHGLARAYSGVSLDTFIKKITFQEVTPEGIFHIGPAVKTLARAEQLNGHSLAVEVRERSSSGEA
jgi:histidinol dehydrogenase